MHVKPPTLACTEALSVAMYGRYISVGRSLEEPLLAHGMEGYAVFRIPIRLRPKFQMIQAYLFCSFGVEPSPTAEIVSGRILAAPLFLEIVPQKGQYRGFRGYSPNRSIQVWRSGLLSGGVKRESMSWFVHDVPVTSLCRSCRPHRQRVSCADKLLCSSTSTRRRRSSDKGTGPVDPRRYSSSRSPSRVLPHQRLP